LFFEGATRGINAYCEKEKIPFYILVALDNAPGHSLNVSALDENINMSYVHHHNMDSWIRGLLHILKPITFIKPFPSLSRNVIQRILVSKW
jgi:hypothetical protein